MSRRYDLVAMGGTFDVLHKGHKALLREAFKAGKKVIIGLTSDRFVQSEKKKHYVDPYEIREAALKSCLEEMGVAERASIVRLDDPWGPATTDPKVEALIATEETRGAVRKINEIRTVAGMNPLRLVVVGMMLAEDGERISSTRIRKGEINREGETPTSFR